MHGDGGIITVVDELLSIVQCYVCRSQMFKLIIALFTLTLNVFCAAEAKYLIAITKITPHPSLDLIEKGIKDELVNSGLEIEFQTDNAQGNISTAVQIAKKYAALKPDLIIPITTPSAQTVYKAALSQNIPVVYAGVSDPVAAHLIDASTRRGQNITGVSDLPPIAEQINLIRTLQPSAQRIGVLYNPGEPNSVVLVELFKNQAAAQGFKIFLFPCLSVMELVAITKRIQGTVDALYIPNDNTIISGLNIVLNNLPDISVYASDPESVARGCLASAAISQYQIGQEAGKLAVRVLKGEDPSSIPAVEASATQVTINPQAAARLKIAIPADLLQNAQIITGE